MSPDSAGPSSSSSSSAAAARTQRRQYRAVDCTCSRRVTRGPIATTSAVLVEQLDELVNCDATVASSADRQQQALAHGRPARKQKKRNGAAARRPKKQRATPSDAVANGYEDELKRCEAVTRSDESCSNVVVGGHKGKVSRLWCATHENEERVVRQEFQRA